MSEDEQEERRVPRGRQSALDQQKAHLQKLMANPVSMHLSMLCPTTPQAYDGHSLYMEF